MKIQCNGIVFDSELELEYVNYLREQGLRFIYHPKKPIHLTAKNSYTPDFIVFYDDRIEIIETKGYNQFSFLKDNMTHNLMMSKSEEELRTWLLENDVITDKTIKYRKIKHLQKYGWVDFNFKNPNTLANQRKEKINDLTAEIKELRNFKKDTIRYFNLVEKPKKTALQEEFILNYRNKINELK